MRVFVATGRTQGMRPNDFHYCVEGELVRIDNPCARDYDGTRGDCGCGRSFSGLSSARATTTAMIAESELTRAEYIEAVRFSRATQGYATGQAQVEAEELLDFATQWPVGTVVERDMWDFSARPMTRA